MPKERAELGKVREAMSESQTTAFLRLKSFVSSGRGGGCCTDGGVFSGAGETVVVEEGIREIPGGVMVVETKR